MNDVRKKVAVHPDISHYWCEAGAARKSALTCIQLQIYLETRSLHYFLNKTGFNNRAHPDMVCDATSCYAMLCNAI